MPAPWQSCASALTIPISRRRPRCWLRREHGGYLKYVQFASQQHKQTLFAQPLKGAMLERFTTSVKDSLTPQRRLEARDESSFENYVANYSA